MKRQEFKPNYDFLDGVGIETYLNIIVRLHESEEVSPVRFREYPNLRLAEMQANWAAYAVAALNYAIMFERNENVAHKAITEFTLPFLSLVAEIWPHLPADQRAILFLGTGTSRDLQVALELGFEAYGLDYSPMMVELSKQYVRAQLGLQPNVAMGDILQLPKLQQHFAKDRINVPAQYAAICLESAAAFIKKKQMGRVLTDIAQLLVDPDEHGENGGILLLGFRVTESGHVYYVQDPGIGVRYFTSFTPAQAEALITDSGLFEIVRVEYKEHPAGGPSVRPPFLNIYARKKRPTTQAA